MDVEPWDGGRPITTLRYSVEHITPAQVTETFSRGVMDGTAGYEILDGIGLWARVRWTGPWFEGGASWTVTDLEFGPAAALRDLAGRFDLDGWFTFAAPAGDDPSGDVWYGGAGDWSYGAGARLSAMVFGVGRSSHMVAAFDVRFRSRARRGWIYLPYHSVAIRDSVDASAGSTLSWQARIEMRSGRARLATAVLRETPADAESILSGMEKPLYIIQSAGLSVGKGVGVFAAGELLLSGDDEDTAFDPRSSFPAWSFSLGLAWRR